MTRLDEFELQLSAAADPSARLQALLRFAFEAARVGQASLALGLVEQAESLARELDDKPAQGHAAAIRGTCHYLRADYIVALEHCVAACAVAESHRDQEGLVTALLGAAACHYQMGTLEEAHTALMQVLGIIEVIPDDGQAFRAHNTLGAIFSNRGKFEDAEAHFAEAIAIAERTGDQIHQKRARVNRAGLHHKIGLALSNAQQVTEASDYFRRAADVCEKIRGDTGGPAIQRDIASCVGTLGEIYVSMGRLDDALALFAEMHDHGAAMQNPHVQAKALLHRGRLHTLRGEFEQAHASLEECLALASSVNLQHLVAKGHESLAQLSENKGDYKTALASYKTFFSVHEQCLRRELDSTARARAIWLEFQQARREAQTYRERAERLSLHNEELNERATSYEKAALEDALTGLSNRRHLDQRLAELVAAAREQGQRLCVAVADIDEFKSINDRFTHTLGDQVLKSVAEMIRAHCREGDLSARYGGDEFVVCLPGTVADAAEQMFERLRGVVAGHDWQVHHPELRVTISIGVAEIAAHEGVESLLKRADEALYRAKNKGRNRVVSA